MSNLENRVGLVNNKIARTLATATFLSYMCLSSGCAFLAGQIIGGNNAVMVRSEYDITRDQQDRLIRIQTFYWDRNGKDDDGDGKLEEDYATYERKPL